MPLILASSSPRRRLLLEAVGYDVTVITPHADETPLAGENATALVTRLALAKAQSVESRGDIVIAADTVVTIGDDILGKPSDRADATAILTRLSGTRHDVITGYCVRRDEETHTGSVTSTVQFRACTEGEVASYVASGEADDKAGAYGIQGLGVALVESVTGSYTNVVGLPMTEIIAAVRRLGC